ncbi:MAG: metallophosphoesterase [Clostridium sp.]
MILILLIIICLSLFLYIENNRISIKEYLLEEDIPSGFNNFKIVHLSDLHSKEFGYKQVRLIDKIQRLSPDIIVITGDIIDSRRTKKGSYSSIEYLLDGINKISPIYYVSGNHEHRSNLYNDLVCILKKFNVKIIDNRSLQIIRNSSSIYIQGLEDIYSISKGRIQNEHLEIFSHSLSRISKNNSDKNYKVMITHRPEFIELYSRENINLILCGHAHGGQIRIPFIGGILSPSQGFFPKYSEGLHKINNTKMIISRGLGNSIFPFRVFNPPEIVSIVIKKEDAK